MRDLLGPPDDDAFWAVHADDSSPSFRRYVEELYSTDTGKKATVIGIVRSMEVSQRRQLAELADRYRGHLLERALSQMRDRLSQLEREHRDIMSGESKHGCRHLSDGLSNMKIWILAGAATYLVTAVILLVNMLTGK